MISLHHPTINSEHRNESPKKPPWRSPFPTEGRLFWKPGSDCKDNQTAKEIEATGQASLSDKSQSPGREEMNPQTWDEDMWVDALERLKPQGVPEPARLVSFSLVVEENNFPLPKDPRKSFSEADKADASLIMLVYLNVCSSLPSLPLCQKLRDRSQHSLSHTVRDVIDFIF